MADTVLARTRSAVEGLTPGYFALVMASGILSVGLKLEGFETISVLLLVVCVAAFVVLLLLTLWRLRGALDRRARPGRTARRRRRQRHLVHLGGRPLVFVAMTVHVTRTVLMPAGSDADPG